ncbi:hypothetical protein [Pseudomonas sp. Marseille-P9899]|uniref:hypothetical protein n=1 Tax=Pseudomonas sp. Marseille-P9899 TaxID=2730401 RepID=UPI002113C0D8|nr:hypothetical protein [Pseudomonas sp. Marseille-P9899]
MDGLVEYELTVRPVFKENEVRDFQVVVRARFSGEDGSEYLGCLYWSNDEIVEYLKPVVLLDDGAAVFFGMEW